MEPAQKPIAPPGLQKLIDKCILLYPDQPNPLQVTTLLKYWLGGQDPLDYISMYYNQGNVDLNIPPHWHYISFGLSDLHGDGRVHAKDPMNYPSEARSGMGFELTFRLLKTPLTTERPPTWPANLLQALARYVFQTGNRLCVGDNIPWRNSLDNINMSKIKHMLIAEDPQMKRIETPFGWVDFCQIVGVTEEEVEQASRWNGNGIINMLKNDVKTGGEWLITDMTRRQSVFEMFPETLRQLEQDLEMEGSDLAGVNAEFSYRELTRTKIKTEFSPPDSPPSPSLTTMMNFIGKSTGNCSNSIPTRTIKTENSNICMMDKDSKTLPINSSSNCYSLEMSCPLDYHPMSTRVIHLDGVHLILAPYAAKFLMLAIKDRIRHGRHFTFKYQNAAITFVSESVTGAVVSRNHPYGVLGYWMQVLIVDELMPKMIETFKEITASAMEDKSILPRHFEWPEYNLKIDIDNPTTTRTAANEQIY